jgi:hypothetical protein
MACGSTTTQRKAQQEGLISRAMKSEVVDGTGRMTIVVDDLRLFDGAEATWRSLVAIRVDPGVEVEVRVNALTRQ